MLQQILKEKTQSLHNELENLMFVKEIMNKSLSLNQYKKNILINYVAHKAFEHRLFEQLSDDLKNKLDIDSRKKLPALELDIEQLNIEEGDVLFTSSVKEIQQNDAFILGALYVLEGATLGGHVIAKNLSTNPNFTSSAISLNYYNVYVDNLVDKWKSFVSVLNEVPEEEYQSAIFGAMMMFEAMISIAKAYNNL